LALPTDRLINPVKARMQAGEVALGMPVRLARSGDVARIAKTTGHDFIFIDCQHSLFNLETIGHIASTALSVGVAPLVRVRGIDDPDVSLLLDTGALGIVYPDVPTLSRRRRRSISASSRRSANARLPPAIRNSTTVRCRLARACRSLTTRASWSA
jgi:2-keto-3-deoxy-L-rhamnonate aldolase RhmA